MKKTAAPTRQQLIDAGKIWQVTDRKEPDNILFEGSKKECVDWVNNNWQNIKYKDLRVGKLIWEKEEQPAPATPVKDEGYTKGNWCMAQYPPCDFGIYSDTGNGRDIALVRGQHDNAETIANAELIVSAPKLKAENEQLKEQSRELLKMLNHIRDAYWDLMAEETCADIDNVIQKHSK